MMRLIFITSLFFICGILRAEIPNIKSERHTSSVSGQSTAAVAEADIQILAAMPLETLVNKIKSTADPKERAKVRMQIWQCVPQNIKELNNLLDIADAEKIYEIQRDILRALEDTKDVSFGPAFHKRIKKGNYNVRAVAIGKLAELKCKDAVPDLITIVENFNPKKVREEDEAIASLEAFFALGEIGDDRAIPALMHKLGRLNGQDEQVISKFGGKILPQLIDVVKNTKDKERRESAYIAVNGIKDTDTMPTLWQILRQEKDARLRSACAGALMSMATDNSNPNRTQLEAYIYDEARNDRQTFGMGYYAVLAARINKNIEYLEHTAGDKNKLKNIRTDAIDALGDLKSQSSIPTLENLLKESNKEIRMTAAGALKKITGKDYNWELK